MQIILKVFYIQFLFIKNLYVLLCITYKKLSDIMKSKKLLIFISALIIGSLVFASCAIGKKCPAYTKAEISNPITKA